MRGQTGFEYLLILGGVVLLASTMLVFVRGNLDTVSPDMNLNLGSINRLTAAVGADVTCSDCDAVFVNEGQPNSISNGMLASDSVDSGKLANNSVSNAKIVAGSVDSSKLADGSVVAAKIGAGAVDSSKLAANAVDSSKVADGSIGFIDINTAQVQRRVTGTCSVGSYITAIAADGSVTCGAVTTSWVTSGSSQYSSVSGNVGIGTSSPSQKLDVAGGITASGNIYSAGDVCNAAGACLSDITGLIGGTALVGNQHTYSACTAAGGEVVDSDVSFKQCRFNASTCPGGWTKYRNFTTAANQSATGSGNCQAYNNGWGNYVCCYTTCYVSHPWGNTVSTCTYQTNAYLYTDTMLSCHSTTMTLTATQFTQVGCY